jgi:hypothetical protein
MNVSSKEIIFDFSQQKADQNGDGISGNGISRKRFINFMSKYD